MSQTLAAGDRRREEPAGGERSASRSDRWRGMPHPGGQRTVAEPFAILRQAKVSSTARRREEKGPWENGVVRSGGGLTGKVMAMAYAPGHPVDTVVPPGRERDPRGLPEPMEGRSSGAPVGDGAFDADRPVGRGAEAVIPSRGNRKGVRGHDGGMYGWRCRTGNRFARIGEFRAVATRCERTGPGFRATVPAAAAVIAARWMSTGPGTGCSRGSPGTGTFVR